MDNTSAGDLTLPSCQPFQEPSICDMIAPMVNNAERRNIILQDLSQSSWIWACLGFYGPLGLFGILGNTLTIIMFTKFIKPTTTSIFIITLAILDLTVCAVVMPLWFVESFELDFVSDFFCRLYRFVQFMAIPMSGFILMAIALDRFLLIVLVNGNVLTPFRAKIIIACIAVVCAGIAMPFALYWSVYTEVGSLSATCVGGTYCNFGKCKGSVRQIKREVVYTGYQIIMALFVIMVIVFSIAYALIFFKVLRMHRKMRSWKTSNNNGENSGNKINNPKRDAAEQLPAAHASKVEETSVGDNSPSESEKLVQPSALPIKGAPKKRLPHVNTAITLSLVTVTFIVAYAPNIILMSLGICKDTEKNVCSPNSGYYFVWNLFFLNHITNPIIYSFMNPRFKEALKELFKYNQKQAGLVRPREIEMTATTALS